MGTKNPGCCFFVRVLHHSTIHRDQGIIQPPGEAADILT